MVQLASHFTNVIEEIRSHKFRHYSIPKTQKGKGPGYFEHQKMEKKKVLDENPLCFLLQPSSLRIRLTKCRDTIIKSFRVFDFTTYHPCVSDWFGAVIDAGSGIESLFPPRQAGRPKKLQLAAYADDKASETTSLVDILGQAIDRATKEIFVLVQWVGSTDDDITWVPFRNLSNVTQAWWVSESDRRFPHIDLTKEAPLLRITDGTVTVFDDSGDESL